MDGRDALPGAAPDGGEWLDQIALGGDGERPQTQILFNQKGRPPGPQSKTRTMGTDFFGPQRSMERTTCLISISQSRNGGSRCSPLASKLPKRSRNWKPTCA